jgi:ParB-like chromosome segregation protein Spo0J
MSKLIDEIRAAGASDDQPGIKPEFRDLLDVQTEASYGELKKLIERDGIRDPIVVWTEQNMIVDGHNRFKIAKELNIPCPTKGISFKDEAEAKQWIIRNQLGRRNLTPARFEYYVGKLYNEQKLENVEDRLASKGGQNTAEKIAKEVGVSPKTVRRYAATAKGVDNLEKVKGKIAKAQQLSSKPLYTGEEIAAIGSASNATVAAKVIENVDTIHKAKAAKKVEVKKEQAAIAAKATLYNVVLCEPGFGATGFSLSTEPKPTMDKEAVVYMIVPDEHLKDGIDLLVKWNLKYEASLVYYSAKTYPGQWTKIAHQFVLIASKGQIVLVQAGKEAASAILLNGEIGPHILKLIDLYHPNGGQRKLDMRRGVKPLAGWDAVTK